MGCRADLTLCLLLAMAASVAQAEPETAAAPEPMPEAGYLGEPGIPYADPGGYVPPVGYDYYFHPWYASVDALFLQRTGAAGGQTIVQTSGTATPVVDRGNFDFPMVAGPRILLGKRTDVYSAVEASYFGTHFWRSTITPINPNNLDLPGAIGLAAADFHQADAMRLTYTSQLQNAEVNYVRLGDGVSYLAGVRYLNWLERFNIRSQDDANQSIYDLNTTNNLVGGQIGARTCWVGQNFNWDLTGKAGLFGNSANQRQRLTDANNTLLLRDTRSSGSEFSFVGDINLNASRRLSRCCQVRAGYNLMLITGLALAPHQLDFTNTATSGTHLDRDGAVFLHGVNVGLDIQW